MHLYTRKGNFLKYPTKHDEHSFTHPLHFIFIEHAYMLTTQWVWGSAAPFSSLNRANQASLYLEKYRAIFFGHGSLRCFYFHLPILFKEENPPMEIIKHKILYNLGLILWIELIISLFDTVKIIFVNGLICLLYLFAHFVVLFCKFGI